MRTRREYEDKGYADMAASGSFRISECPYSDGWQREAWQAGAWRWMQEQRERKAAEGSKKSSAQIRREVKEILLGKSEDLADRVAKQR